MLADIRLGASGDGDGRPEWLVLEGDVVKAEGADLHLDCAPRRSSSTGHRRALVHDFEDGLTVNFNGDYPGGVTIHDARLHGVRIQQVVQGPGDAELPRDGQPGDVLFIHHGPDPAGIVLSRSSLWICVPMTADVAPFGAGPGAWWQEIPLSPPVQGTA